MYVTYDTPDSSDKQNHSCTENSTSEYCISKSTIDISSNPLLYKHACVQHVTKTSPDHRVTRGLIASLAIKERNNSNLACSDNSKCGRHVWSERWRHAAAVVAQRVRWRTIRRAIVNASIAELCVASRWTSFTDDLRRAARWRRVDVVVMIQRSVSVD